jgi:glycosyltransferase involved in cell wall biosynthesis
MNDKISIIIPAKDEDLALTKVISECFAVLSENNINGEVIVIDDGSKDETYKVACSLKQRYPFLKIIKHEINLGKVAAIRTGVSEAKGDVLVFMDGDFTYPAEYIPRMLIELDEGADLVIGNRLNGDARNIPYFNKIGNKLFSFLISYFGGTEIIDGQSGLRALRATHFHMFDVEAKSLEYEAKMTLKAAKNGFKIVEIPIAYRPRIGKSKLNPFSDGLKMIRAIFDIVLSESSTLAKVIMLPSIIFFFLSLIFGGISIYEKISRGILIHEYYPLLSVLFIIVGVQLFSIGIILDNISKRLDRIEHKIINNKKD